MDNETYSGECDGCGMFGQVFYREGYWYCAPCAIFFPGAGIIAYIVIAEVMAIGALWFSIYGFPMILFWLMSRR